MSLVTIAKDARSDLFQWNDIENVLPVLHNWSCTDKRVVLVTLVGIEGASPRNLGAQMAISEDGEAFGHISGGCLKQEVINQALSCIKANENRCIRYGAGSKYIDIVLPCGSGIDLYFDQAVPASLLRTCFLYSGQRQPFALTTDLNTGVSELTRPTKGEAFKQKTDNYDGRFVRIYKPGLKLIVQGTDPSVLPLARLARASEMDVRIQSPDRDIIDEAAREGLHAEEITYGQSNLFQSCDGWTAIVLLFHDHNWEAPILEQALSTDSFYIGAQGSKRTHNTRIAALASRNLSDKDIARIKGPIGLIQMSKSPVELAISTLADIVDQAKKCGKTN